MPLTRAAAEQLLDQIGDSLWISLHEGDPGEDGRYELSGLSYRRQPMKMRKVRDGVRANADTVLFPVLPQGIPIKHVGLWTARDGGMLMWPLKLAEPITAGQGDMGHIPPGAIVISLVRNQDVPKQPA